MYDFRKSLSKKYSFISKIMKRCRVCRSTRSHPPDSPFCLQCDRTFGRMENLRIHIATQHSETVEMLLCKYWPRCFDARHQDGLYSTKSNLVVHLKKHHKIKSDTRRRLLAKQAERFFVRRTR